MANDGNKKGDGILAGVGRFVGITYTPSKDSDSLKENESPSVQSTAFSGSGQSGSRSTTADPTARMAFRSRQAVFPQASVPTTSAISANTEEYEFFVKAFLEKLKTDENEAFFSFEEMLKQMFSIGSMPEAACYKAAATAVRLISANAPAMVSIVQRVLASLDFEKTKAEKEVSDKSKTAMDNRQKELELINAQVEQLTVQLNDLQQRKNEAEADIQSGQAKLDGHLANISQAYQSLRSQIEATGDGIQAHCCNSK